MSEVQLKAYAVLEEMEHTGGIVFAKSNAQARREGACRFSDGDFHSVTCRRASFADHCAEVGTVPAALLISNGWHFECAWTGVRIDEDSLAEHDLYPEDVVGTQDSLVFINGIAAAEYALEKAKCDHVARRWDRRLRRLVFAKFPSAKILPKRRLDSGASISGGIARLSYCRVAFEFDGMQVGPAALEFNRNNQSVRRLRLLCCAGDQEAFEVFAANERSKRQ